MLLADTEDIMGVGVQEWVRRNWWQIVVLTLGGWSGFYFALILPMHLEYSRQVASQRNTGLGAVAGWDPISLWRQSSLLDIFRQPQIAAQRGHRYAAYAMGLTVPSELPDTGSSTESRYIVRSAEFELEVKSPAGFRRKDSRFG